MGAWGSIPFGSEDLVASGLDLQLVKMKYSERPKNDAISSTYSIEHQLGFSCSYRDPFVECREVFLFNMWWMLSLLSSIRLYMDYYYILYRNELFANNVKLSRLIDVRCRNSV